MRGRKPIPSHLRALRNNPGKRPLNHDEPKPPVSTGAEPPAYLADKAKDRWRVIAPQLEKSGVLSTIDVDALASYCTVWMRWRRAEDQIETSGDIVKTPNGLFQQSPYISIASNLLKHVRSYETEFGMTPSSRSRVKSAGSGGPSEQDDKFEDRAPKLRRVK